jgi:hypothetical protein
MKAGGATAMMPIAISAAIRNSAVVIASVGIIIWAYGEGVFAEYGMRVGLIVWLPCSHRLTEKLG